MKKNFIYIALSLITALLLSACCNSIPPARLKWNPDPTKIQRVNCNPLNPYCHS